MSSIEDDLKNDILKGEEQKSDISKTSELLLNEKYKRRKTILQPRQVFALSRIDTFAQIWDVQFFKTFYDSETEHLTSVKGQGRRDIVDIVKYNIERQDNNRKELLEALGKK